MSAEMLDMREAQYEALLWIRDQLDQGMLQHVDADIPIAGRGFNMLNWKHAYSHDIIKIILGVGTETVGVPECGTVCCIGGWMAEKMGMNHWANDGYGDDLFPISDDLYRLFNPSMHVSRWAGITAAMAVQAIDNFLETGFSDWNAVWDKAHAS
jgi:hypothetical protein